MLLCFFLAANAGLSELRPDPAGNNNHDYGLNGSNLGILNFLFFGDAKVMLHSRDAPDCHGRRPFSRLKGRTRMARPFLGEGDLGCFAFGGLVGGGGVYVVGRDFGCPLVHRLQDLAHHRKLVPVLALGVRFGLPEAEGQDRIRVGARYKCDLVHKTGLLFEDRQHLLIL